MISEAFRGGIFHFLSDPKDGLTGCYEFFEDGLLVVESGRITQLGDAELLIGELDISVKIHDYTRKIICPGFVDTHVHYPQLAIIGSYGESLLHWLENYAFDEEKKFNDADHSLKTANHFLDELLRCGTTTAQVFGTVHPESVEGFFTAAEHRDLRMICGKVLMDRNGPQGLLDTPETSYIDSKNLIERWHGRGRLRYAVSPRFAPTSTPDQLATAGQLLREYPGTHLQTHLSEDQEEIKWVKSLFPSCKNYLDVYKRAGLLGKRSTFAHCLHLTEADWEILEYEGCSVAFCPSSNLFLGSGLFDLPRPQFANVKVGIGTDVGAGTSLSMLQTIADAYKTQRLAGNDLGPLSGLYMATLGGAKSLDCDADIGNFKIGKEADFTVLDPESTPLMSYRMQNCKSLEERLAVIVLLGDDRAILATYANGHCVHHRDIDEES